MATTTMLRIRPDVIKLDDDDGDGYDEEDEKRQAGRLT